MSQQLNRLITFEIDDEEVLVLMAGRDELDNRVIFHGPTEPGRYAIVPVDGLAEDDDRDQEDVDLLVDELEVGMILFSFQTNLCGCEGYARVDYREIEVPDESVWI